MDNQDKLDVVKYFEANRDSPFAIAGMKALLEFAKEDDSTTTMQEFIAKMRDGRKILQSSSHHVSVRSGTELFVRFITNSQMELEQAIEFRACREILLKRGRTFIEQIERCSNKIMAFCDNLITDDMIILTHGRCPNVLNLMKKEFKNGLRFKVFVTEAQPVCDGRQMATELRDFGIPTVVILDSSVSFFIENIDAVIIGTQGVCENGGLINTIGTCNIAMLAKSKFKPVYVVTESFKFVRMFPLNNRRIPKEYVYPPEVLKSGEDLDHVQPLVDYTDPKYLDYIYCDLGVLHTSAIYSEMTSMYM